MCVCRALIIKKKTRSIHTASNELKMLHLIIFYYYYYYKFAETLS
jgi:hypothetical protein